MTCKELLARIVAKAGWFDKSNTVDQILFGDPDKPVSRVLVTWQADLDTIEQAAARGYDAMMVHEPLLYTHAHEQENLKNWIPGVREGALRRRMERLAQAGLTVIRNHDTWDRMPEVGIPFAWARFLGLSGHPDATDYQGYEHAYDIEPVTAGALARRIAQRTRDLGEPAVQLLGDPERRVTRLGLGTGCACWVDGYRRMGCQAGIVVDDGQLYWRDFCYAKDEGISLIRVLHATSEEPGMVTMAEWLNRQGWGIEADYAPFNTQMRWIDAGR